MDDLSLEIINKRSFKKRKWYLLLDRNRFHVFIGVVINKNLTIRIDWNRDATLTFKKYEEYIYEEKTFLGKRDFSKSEIKKLMKNKLKNYDLFYFNCRTVTYMILTKIVHFDSHEVYNLFKQYSIMCGLKEEECLSMEEIEHFISFQEEEIDCTIF